MEGHRSLAGRLARAQASRMVAMFFMWVLFFVLAGAALVAIIDGSRGYRGDGPDR